MATYFTLVSGVGAFRAAPLIALTIASAAAATLNFCGSKFLVFVGGGAKQSA